MRATIECFPKGFAQGRHTTTTTQWGFERDIAGRDAQLRKLIACGSDYERLDAVNETPWYLLAPGKTFLVHSGADYSEPSPSAALAYELKLCFTEHEYVNIACRSHEERVKLASHFHSLGQLELDSQKMKIAIIAFADRTVAFDDLFTFRRSRLSSPRKRDREISVKVRPLIDVVIGNLNILPANFAHLLSHGTRAEVEAAGETIERRAQALLAKTNDAFVQEAVDALRRVLKCGTAYAFWGQVSCAPYTFKAYSTNIAEGKGQPEETRLLGAPRLVFEECKRAGLNPSLSECGEDSGWFSGYHVYIAWEQRTTELDPPKPTDNLL